MALMVLAMQNHEAGLVPEPDTILNQGIPNVDEMQGYQSGVFTPARNGLTIEFVFENNVILSKVAVSCEERLEG